MAKQLMRYLLTGPEKNGKTSTARIFAKSLNCQNGPTLEPCGICPSCVDIAAGSAIDVIEIDAASNRKVEDARNLLEKVQFVPVAGKYKIYIIDEVHMLTTEAFNTLVKTLEEPPLILFLFSQQQKLIRCLTPFASRCQRF
ncbi:MAG: AAA family ATPase [Bacillus subtilis]|nr:AAA family ATPase [Bacillus subtilis]